MCVVGGGLGKSWLRFALPLLFSSNSFLFVSGSRLLSLGSLGKRACKAQFKLCVSGNNSLHDKYLISHLSVQLTVANPGEGPHPIFRK